jgi:hypothetical protein
MNAELVNMDIEVVQALIVLPAVLLEMGLFYVALRKVWKRSRPEARSMTIGIALLSSVGAWLCRWGSDCAGPCGFGQVG